jgi:hypothetical protein
MSLTGPAAPSFALPRIASETYPLPAWSGVLGVVERDDAVPMHAPGAVNVFEVIPAIGDDADRVRTLIRR